MQQYGCDAIKIPLDISIYIAAKQEFDMRWKTTISSKTCVYVCVCVCVSL